jgi:hypothetical protein
MSQHSHTYSVLDATAHAPVAAECLNRGYACRTLDRERLRHQLEAEPTLVGLYEDIARSRPHLFSATTVFISLEQYRRMSAIIAAVEDVVTRPAYQAATLVRAPAIASLECGSRSVFMGFDFHLGEQSPQLIEINTNAGGALLNTVLARSQLACCREMKWAFQPPTELMRMEQTFFSMFAEEWRRQRGDAPLGRIPIVDDDPAAQYLYPEFQLFGRLFARFGADAVIADARELEWRDGKRRYVLCRKAYLPLNELSPTGVPGFASASKFTSSSKRSFWPDTPSPER